MLESSVTPLALFEKSSMKKKSNSTYLEPRSTVVQELFSTPKNLIFFPAFLSMVPYLEIARKQPPFQVFELDSLHPFKSALDGIQAQYQQSFSPEAFLDFLKTTKTPIRWALQTAGDLDYWFSSFLLQLFQQPLSHQVWIQGQASALRSLNVLPYLDLQALPEEELHATEFVQECLLTEKQKPILSSKEEQLLTLASIEGICFSAPMLWRLSQEFSIEFTDQDHLEDYLDEALDSLVEHYGFWQNTFSLYRFRYPVIYSFFRKRIPQTFPFLEVRYHGLFELYAPLKYNAETVFPSVCSTPQEAERFLRYQRFGPFLENPPCPLEWLPESWRRLYYEALGQSSREQGKWNKNLKCFEMAQSSINDLELALQIRALRETRQWSVLETTLNATLQTLSSTETRKAGTLLFELGSLALIQKQPINALALFSRAEEQYLRGFHFQELVRLWIRIFDIEFTQDSFDKAMAALNKAKKYAVSETPEWFLLYHRLGYFYQMFGEWDLALDYLRKAEQNEEKWGPAEEVLEFYTRIAHLLLNQLELEESRYYYKKALNLAEKQNNLLQKTLIFTSLTDLCIRIHDLESAENYYHQSLIAWNLLSPKEQKDFESLIRKPLEEMSSLFQQSR